MLQNEFIVIVTKAATKSTRMLGRWLSRSERPWLLGLKLKENKYFKS